MNDLIVYYLKYPGTNLIYFENRENLLKALNEALDSCLADCNDGFPFEIRIGCIDLLAKQ